MEEVSVLIQKSQAGDKKAREVLVENNLGLVRVIVRRFAGRGYDQEDLFQIGSIGLMKAIDKFDLTMNLKFSTYAVPMITGEIKRFIRDDGMVKVSRTIKENGVKVAKARQSLQNRLGRDPTLLEIQLSTGLEKEDVVLALEAGSEVESLYSAINGEDGSSMYLVDRVILGEQGGLGINSKNNSMYLEDREKEKLLDHMLLRELMETLEEKEQKLLYMRYFENRTQVDIAGDFGVSQVQISRMEKKILRRLREQIQ